MHQNRWRVGLRPRPHKLSSPRSTHCWIGWRWGERWICLQSQFLDYTTVVNLNRTKSFFFDLKCTKIAGGWGFAPDPAEGAYSAPPDPLAVRGEGGGKFGPPLWNPKYATASNVLPISLGSKSPTDSATIKLRSLELPPKHLRAYSSMLPLKPITSTLFSYYHPLNSINNWKLISSFTPILSFPTLELDLASLIYVIHSSFISISFTAYFYLIQNIDRQKYGALFSHH